MFHAIDMPKYRGPRSQMVVCFIDNRTMLKGGSEWGAIAGFNAALFRIHVHQLAAKITSCEDEMMFSHATSCSIAISNINGSELKSAIISERATRKHLCHMMKLSISSIFCFPC